MIRPPWPALQRMAAVLVLALLTACSQHHEPLRIGLSDWPTFQLLHLAQEKGFFRKEGVEVRLLDFGALSDTRRAFESGKLDGLATSVIELLAVRDASLHDLRAVAVFDVSEGGDVILAPKNIRSMRDLRGHRIGIEPASLSTFLLARALEKEGLKFADVIAVPKEPRGMCNELLEGSLDAAVTYPPQSARVLANPRFRTIFSSRNIPGEIIDVLAFDAESLRTRPHEVAAVTRALKHAWQFLADNPEESLRIMAKCPQVSTAEFERQLSKGILLIPPEQQSAYLGPNGKLRIAAASAAQTLLNAGLLSDRPDLTDLIAELP